MLDKNIFNSKKSQHANFFKQSFNNSNIIFKINIIYVVSIIICIFCNAAIAHYFYTIQTKSTITKLVSQTMETISQTVDNSLNSIAKTSTYLLGTSEVQIYLQNNDKSDYAKAKNLRNALYLSLESMPMASSILIINENGYYESAARYTLPNILLTSPQKAAWYKKLHQIKGKPIFLINGGGYFKFKDGKNYITLIRLINSTETASPLGYMMINISLDSLLTNAQKNNISYSDICVYAQGKMIFSSLNEALNHYLKKSSPEKLPLKSDLFINNERYLLLNFQDSTYEWNYLSAIKYKAFTNETKPFLLIFIFTMFLSAALFLLIAFYTNKFITAPIHRLTSDMRKIEDGNLKHVHVTQNKDEIGLLQEAYNVMIDKIQNLLETKIFEQKLIRKAELNILQEQIKPHFLYNSLSAIAYLISSEQNDKANDMIISLSDYYRESLSKGNETVSLATEINIVKNYLKLQKMRFPDIFDDIYNIQEETLNQQIPRLVLQPLAENALYHGIIPTCEYGTIKIKAYINCNRLILCISDDGIGITADKLTEILGDKLTNNVASFGLRGTVERLKIFYDEKEIYQIKSKPHYGTEITFSLPIKIMEEQNESK